MADKPRPYREVTDPKEQQELMRKTALDIHLAAQEPHHDVFLAAHGAADSIVVCRLTCVLMVWQITSGSKDERKALAARVRSKLIPTAERWSPSAAGYKLEFNLAVYRRRMGRLVRFVDV